MARYFVSGLLLLLAVSLCQASEPGLRVAKIDMREIEELLLEVAFARPENQEIRDRYAVWQAREDAFKHRGPDAIEDSHLYAMDMFEIKPIVEDLARAELIVLIEDIFEDQFQLVINDGYGGGILYTEAAIPDITPNIRQRLLTNRLTEQMKLDEPASDDPVERE